MSTVKFLGPDTDAYVSSLVKHVGEFEKQSGMSVELTIVPTDEYFENRISSHLNANDPTDVYMSGPVLLWEHVKTDNVQDLDEFVASSSSEWNFSDFLPSVIRANRWTGRFGDPLGSGPLMEIPVNCESYNLAYLTSLIDQLGIEPPSTWAEYFAASKKVAEKTGGSVFGFAQRGVDVWHTMYTGYATQVWSYGGRDFDESGKCAIGSDAVVRATEDFIQALHSAGPADWTSRRWYELAIDFANGHYAFMVDSDHYVAYFEDPSLSANVGNISYALPPAGPTGLIKPNLWTWSLVMNKKSLRKQEAWSFIEWASSSQFLTRSVAEGNMNPTRTSTWNSEEFASLSAGWNNFAHVSRRLVEEYADVLVTPATNYRAVANRWVRALLDAYLGKGDVKSLLAAAAKDIDALVER